jgi:hypothetical protein
MVVLAGLTVLVPDVATLLPLRVAESALLEVQVNVAV